MAVPAIAQGSCANDRTISRQEIEGRILKGHQAEPLTPELVAEFTRAYLEEINRLVLEAGAEEAEVRAPLAGVQRKIDGMIRATEDGLHQPSMKAHLIDLEAEKTTLLAPADTQDPRQNVGPSQSRRCTRRRSQRWRGCWRMPISAMRRWKRSGR